MSADSLNPKCYTVKSVAKLLDCHQNTILTWIREGKLPAFRIGRGWRIRQYDLRKFMKPQNVKPKAPTCPQDKA